MWPRYYRGVSLEKRPPGRPPQVGESRDKYIRVRATLEEKALWMLASEIEGRDFSPAGRDVLNEWARRILKLEGNTTTIRHLAGLLGRGEDRLLLMAKSDGEPVSPTGRVSTAWALQRIANDSDPQTAAPPAGRMRTSLQK